MTELTKPVRGSRHRCAPQVGSLLLTVAVVAILFASPAHADGSTGHMGSSGSCPHPPDSEDAGRYGSDTRREWRGALRDVLSLPGAVYLDEVDGVPTVGLADLDAHCQAVLDHLERQGIPHDAVAIVEASPVTLAEPVQHRWRPWLVGVLVAGAVGVGGALALIIRRRAGRSGDPTRDAGWSSAPGGGAHRETARPQSRV